MRMPGERLARTRGAAGRGRGGRLVVDEDAPVRQLPVVQGQREEPAVDEVEVRPVQALQRVGPEGMEDLMGKPKYTGYGEKDKQLAKDLAASRSKKDADKAARADGHKDSHAAQTWLRDRSG